MEKNISITYMTLRKMIGILGITMSFIMIFGGLFFGSGKVEISLSAYYLTNMRDFLTGSLFVVSAFLFAYNGYDLMDRIITIIGGAGALFTATFPAYYMEPGNILGLSANVIETLHFFSAGIFFLALAYMSFFQFTKGEKNTKEKIVKNILFRSTGIFIILGLGVMCLTVLESVPDILILVSEVIMLISFGVSWLVKGEAFK